MSKALKMYEWSTKWLSLKAQILFIFFGSFLLYANTLGHKFTLDDGIVIYNNAYVQKGIEGIPKILSKDTFRGFFKEEGKDKLVAGGRYRPLTLVLFACIYELVGLSPFLYHLINIILYGLLCSLLLIVLHNILKATLQKSGEVIAFCCAVLFCFHPIHTECVANIKGMDEILALLFSLSSLYFATKYVTNKSNIPLLFTFIFFTLALFSKENAISYLVLIPLALFLFRKHSATNLVPIIVVLFLATSIFLLVRFSILGFDLFQTESNELMNNPFLKNVNGRYIPMDFSERYGTIFHSLFQYLKLLIFPHPLTHDYYPRHIPVTRLSESISILALTIYGMMTFLFFYFFKKNPLVSFSIAAYLVPLFLVSNIVFPVGTNMGERFVFMSSLGFSLFLAWLLSKIWHLKLVYVSILGIIILAYSIKTITRNLAWYDNETLFYTDIKTSTNSAKINNALAGTLLESLKSEKDSKNFSKIAESAQIYLNKALRIHPLYLDAYVLLGNTYFAQKNYKKAIEQYEIVLKYSPDDKEAYANLQLAHREYGRTLGMKYNDAENAILELKLAHQMNPSDKETLSLMGIAEGIRKNFDQALQYFNQALLLDSTNAQIYFNLGITYQNLSNEIKSQEMFAKAMKLDPGIYKKNGINQ
ncbi:MAG: tetratricopeptide repeat protein [Bacteroidota bacterium]|nr:tetratricopeptide repeat protein [Bacteroidota bacterium]